MRLLLLALLAVPALSCGQQAVALDKAVRVDEVVTGWSDGGITEDRKNKIVPSISMKITNVSQEQLGGVQLNCIFRRVGDPEERGAVLVRAVDRDGLPSGASTEPIVVQSEHGYTGEQSRAQLLDNRLFVDFKVDIFGKHGSATWVKLGEFKIDRQLLTR